MRRQCPPCLARPFNPHNVSPRPRYRDFLRANPRRELEDELRFHIETETEELISRGVSPAGARQQALARFGDIDRYMTECGASDRRRLNRRRRTRVMEALQQDAGFALRGFGRRPMFAISAVLVMALGVGANAAVLSVVDHIFLRPPAVVESPGELRRAYVERQRQNGERYFQVRFSYPEARILDSTISEAFPSAIYFRSRASVNVQAAAPRNAMVGWVSGSWFSVVGVRLHAGTAFVAEDHRLGEPAKSAIVSWSFWREQLGGDVSALGQTIRVDGQPVTVRGILPKGFSGIDIDMTDIWLPIEGVTGFQTARGQAWYEQWGTIAFRVMARVPEGADERQLSARILLAMRHATAQRELEQPSTVRRAAILRAIPAPILTSRGPEEASRNEAIAVALAGLALLLLIIATANVGNLLLGRAADRQRDIAVRQALGMGRGRLVLQVAIESTLLAIASTVAALVAATWVGAALRSMVLPGTQLATGPVDVRIAALALSAGLLAGLAAALVPLGSMLRVDLLRMLKGTSRDGGGQSRARSVLIGVQAALAVVLLAGTGMVARSLYNLRNDDLGLDVPHGVIVHAGDDRSLPLAEVARLARELPGVKSAVLSAEAPLWSQLGTRRLLTRDGDTVRTVTQTGYVAAEPGYLATVGTKLLRGRDFTTTDALGAPAVMIASEEFARLLWPGRDPLGECVRVDLLASPCFTVVGVAQNARVFDLVEELRPVFYVPLEQRPDREPGVEPAINALVLRVDGPVKPVIARIRDLVADTGTVIRTRRVLGMAEILEPRYEPWEIAAKLFTGFAVIAVLLTVVGLNGVLSYLVNLRRHELGVRMALGADRGRVMTQVLGEGVRRIVAGAGVGVLIALVAAKPLTPLLYQVSPRDPLVLLAAVLVLAVCGILAAWAPARRAMTVDPAQALRED
jgi:putative ABC transport system permease protein